MRLSDMQDIIMQDWVMAYEPDTDDEGYTEGEYFTGEIITKQTGEHVCQLDLGPGNKRLAEMILAAHEMYIGMYINCDDNYEVKGEIGDHFLRSMEEMVLHNSY